MPGRLAAEFALLYLGLPLLLALALPPDWLWPALLGATAVAALLLARTPGFHWASLVEGRIAWGEVALVAAAAAAACSLLVWWLLPGRFLALPRRSPGLSHWKATFLHPGSSSSRAVSAASSARSRGSTCRTPRPE